MTLRSSLISPSCDLHRPARLGPHVVPAVWRYMLPPALRAMNFPREPLANCASCPQVEAHGYRPDYRCCTYYPRVSNFLIGLALQNPQAQPLFRQPAVRAFMMPEGFQPSPFLWATFVVESEEDRFGKTDKVLCPFLNKQTGYCGIYAYRNAVCSTFFCEFQYGGQGRRFWDRLQTVAMQVELALGQWALGESGFDLDAYVQRLDFLAENLATWSADGRAWSEEARRHIWNDWYGREEELYSRCAELIAQHKENLWEIANEVEIRDSPRFERASSALVAEPHRDKLLADANDHESDIFATATPAQLWKQVEKQHRKMWRVAKEKELKSTFDDGLSDR